eukprot:Skav227095  [mRNA]  locus=scaffold199:2660:6188:+ [translate_table: standard]
MSDVERWCQSQGIETPGDLAFFFVSYEEAVRQAGEQVAQAWVTANTEVQRGCPGLLTDLYARQSPSVMPVMPPPAKASGKAQPKTPPKAPPAQPGLRLVREVAMPKKRQLPTATPLATKNEPFRPSLEEVLRVASRYSFQGPTGLAMVQPLVSQLLSSHEAETLKKVVATWNDLKAWCQERSLAPSSLSAAEIALFTQECSAPSRVIPALQFLFKNMFVSLDLSLVLALRKATKSAVGIGQRQAPVVQPILLAHLEQALTDAIRSSNAKWTGFYAIWCVAMGCVRWAHVQRSRLQRLTSNHMVWECLRGKQRARRAGFWWSCPRFAVFSNLDFGATFASLVQVIPAEHASIAFDVATLEELPHRVVKSQVALVLSQAVEADHLARISSKSWRQLGVTWAFLSQLDTTQACALGNWIDTSEPKTNVTPWRYHRGKLQQSQALKLLMRSCLHTLVLDYDCQSWHQITPDLAKQVRDEQNASLPSVEDVEWERASETGVTEEQVAIVCGSSFLRKLKERRRVAPVAAPVLPVAVKAMPKPPPATVAKARPSSAPTPRQEAPVESAPADDPDAYFDRLAAERRPRAGHSGDPEPPTFVYNYFPNDLTVGILLGPLPKRHMAPLFHQHRVRLVVTCFDEPLASRGGELPPNIMNVNFPITHFNVGRGVGREKVVTAWRRLWKMILPTLQSRESIYVHCMAGVHRAPVPTAMLVAMLCNEPFDRKLQFIESIRAIESYKLTQDKRNEQLLRWVRQTANQNRLAPVSVELPVRFCCSTQRRGAWHAVSVPIDGAPLQPSCRWKQAPSNPKAFFGEDPVLVNSVHEAIVYERKWCRSCVENLPASIQAILSSSLIEYVRFVIMSLKLAVQWELHLLMVRGPFVQLVGVLRHPASLPLWIAAWTSFRSLMEGVGVSVDGVASCISLSQTAVQLGCCLMGAFELGDIPSLDEARDFAVDAQSVTDAHREFGHLLGQLVEPVACAIAQRSVQQGHRLQSLAGAVERMFRQLEAEDLLPMARVASLFAVELQTKVSSIQFSSAMRGSAHDGIVVPSGGSAGSSCDPAP